MSNPLRALPSVNVVLETPPLVEMRDEHSPDALAEAVRLELDGARQLIRDGKNSIPDVSQLAHAAALRLTVSNQARLRTVINATGIVLHTNLGRAPMAEAAARAAMDAAQRYLNLEIDLDSGNRSSRQDAIRDWLTRLTGAESATAVNNCAAATVIVLRTLAAGKEAIVSRGQLIEIGGSFRIPEIMAVSGATLREVGTTNITRIGDYEKAIGPNTGLLMRVHSSNYRIGGFTHAASLDELVALGRQTGLPVVDDVGSGALFDYSRFGLIGEPLVRDSVNAGADVVLFSGDKLLGGPQAGIIVGKQDIIKRIERDPLMRAFRLDKMTLAALEATLRIYLNESKALNVIPILRMLNTPLGELRQRSETLAEQLRSIPKLAAEVVEDRAYVGGGSLPQQSLPAIVIAVRIEEISVDEMARRLRIGSPSVVGRVNEGRLLLDLRTVFPEQDCKVVDALRRVST